MPKDLAPLDILVVDDEPAVRLSVTRALEEVGHHVTGAEDGGIALELILERVFDVAIFDVRLPRIDGLTLLRRLRRESPGTTVVLMTAYASIGDAVASLRAGAHDYVTKPFDPDELAARVIRPIAERQGLRRQLEQARAELTARDVGAELIGRSPFIARLRAHIDVVAQSDAPLLLKGERGTGKRLVARTVHARGPRRERPFVAVNCAAIPDSLFETELLGYQRGAFAGATHDHPGYLRSAHGGTLLLHDVGAMPLTSEAALVEALREQAARPVGSSRTVPLDVRLIATTHEDLGERVDAGTFREDLFRKLSVLELALVPLRERTTDLPLLFEHFLRRFTRNVPPRITPRAWDLLATHPFPGNVDELADVVKHVLAMSRGSVIDVEHLPASVVHELPGDAEAGTGHKPSGTRRKARPSVPEIADHEHPRSSKEGR